MRFSDERCMWYADTELLAEKLANKSQREVQEILDAHDVIKLRSCERPGFTALNRIAMILFFVPILIICCIKWLLTGDWYLDSWTKRSEILRKALRLACFET